MDFSMYGVIKTDLKTKMALVLSNKQNSVNFLIARELK